MLNLLIYHFIKEKLLGNEICSVFVQGEDFLADMMKRLSKTCWKDYVKS
jgi:hypothetical protein